MQRICLYRKDYINLHICKYLILRRIRFVSDTTIEELKAKVDKLEYTEIKNIKEDIGQIKIDLNTNNLLTQQSIDANNKLSNVIDTMRDTMIEMGQSLKDSNRISSELTDNVSNLSDKVNKVENKLEEKIKNIDDKSKIDILCWMKNNWFGIVGIGGMLYTVISNFAE